MTPGYKPLLDDNEKLSIAELKALQLERLKNSLSHAYNNSKSYREKFDAHGVSPADLQTLEDLAKFPFTEKEDLRQAYPCLLYTSPSPRDATLSRMPSSA